MSTARKLHAHTCPCGAVRYLRKRPGEAYAPKVCWACNRRRQAAVMASMMRRKALLPRNEGVGKWPARSRVPTGETR